MSSVRTPLIDTKFFEVSLQVGSAEKVKSIFLTRLQPHYHAVRAYENLDHLAWEHANGLQYQYPGTDRYRLIQDGIPSSLEKANHRSHGSPGKG